MSSIFGIGLDLIDLAHFQTHYGEASPELLARCFTTRELNDAGSGVNRTARLAARFAAKEATLKALGGGVGVALTDIELLRDESGADPAQENRCRDAGILIALNEVCGTRPLA